MAETTAEFLDKLREAAQARLDYHTDRKFYWQEEQDAVTKTIQDSQDSAAKTVAKLRAALADALPRAEQGTNPNQGE